MRILEGDNLFSKHICGYRLEREILETVGSGLQPLNLLQNQERLTNTERHKLESAMWWGFIAEDFKAHVIAQSLTQMELIRKATNSCVPPGSGNPQELPWLARLQRMVQRGVAVVYRYDYLYVSCRVMEEVEALREQWCYEYVWDF